MILMEIEVSGGRQALVQVEEGRTGYQVHLQLPPGSIKCDRDRPLLLHWVLPEPVTPQTEGGGRGSELAVGWGGGSRACSALIVLFG